MTYNHYIMNKDTIQELVIRGEYDRVYDLIRGGIKPTFYVIDDVSFLEYLVIIKDIPLEIRLELLGITLKNGYKIERVFEKSEFETMERLVVYICGKMAKYECISEIGHIKHESLNRYSRTFELFKPWIENILDNENY